jgi:membrane-bound metal-dependent hydrolase YbcI (DUF457 family)
MDPVSHVVMGRALVAAVGRGAGSAPARGMFAAAIAGALVPDIDCVLMPAGWDIYLRWHQAGTHSAIGACLLGCAAAGLIRGLVRGSRFPALAAAACLAAASHLLLDMLSGAPLAIFWPWSSARLAVPLVAMAGPWLLGLFVLGAIGMRRCRRNPRRAARIVLLAVTVFFGVKTILYDRARRIVATDARVDATAPRLIEARWGSWTEWTLFERDRDALRAWRVSVRTRMVTPLVVWKLAVDTPLVTASRALDTVRHFRRVHDLDFAVERPADDGQTEVLWSDVRYCAQARPGAATIECALWFGGLFGPDGRAVRQVVDLGGWIQQRPVSP